MIDYPARKHGGTWNTCSEVVVQEVRLITVRTACTWAGGTIFICRAVTRSADPTSGCINNCFSDSVSVYISWWRTGFCTPEDKVSMKYAIVVFDPWNQVLFLVGRSVCESLSCDWRVLDWLCPCWTFAAWPAPGNGLHEQRLQQLQLWRRHELLLRQHDHQRPAPPGERRPVGTQKPRRRQNERSDMRRSCTVDKEMLPQWIRLRFYILHPQHQQSGRPIQMN